MATRSHIRITAVGVFIALAGRAGAADSVEAALERQLHARRPEVARWEITALSGPTSSARGPYEIVQIGNMGPHLAVRFADGHVRWYSIAGTGTVLVSPHAITAGETVLGTDLVPAERDLIGLGCEPLRALDSSQPWRAARHLTAGVALCKRSVEPVPDVRRGRPVTLTAAIGPINVSRVLVAASDARTGERVRLRDPQTGDVVAAVVTGADAARSLNSGE